MSTAEEVPTVDAELAGPVGQSAAADWAHRPVTGPRLSGGLLHQWQQRNLEASLPLALRQLETAGNLDNVRLAIAVGDRESGERDVADRAIGDQRRTAGLGPVDPLPGSGYQGPVFMDSDIYKTLEAIGWELAHGPRPELARFASDAITLLEQAQQSDGYLDSYFQVTGEPRYERLAWSHEMYCAGHLIQAAVALSRGAGDDRLLGVATRLADHLVREFAGKERGLDGHPIIETALVELYRQTGVADYLDLARQFVDQRGSGLVGQSGMGRRYLQDHLPVRSAPTEVGHVVRALYLDAGVADVAAQTNDRELLESSVRRWEDMVATKTYLTGGNGSRHSDEGFGDRFELPPDRAYNETCAAIASFHWSWRLLLATGSARYAEHMERVLFNGFASAIATEGQKFFYVNPLQRREDHFEKDDPGRRRTWFSCACCPPNIMRLLASLEHYLATVSGSTLYLHQFTGASLSGAGLSVSVDTEYPWAGTVTIRVDAAEAGERGLAFRIPGWSAVTRYRIGDGPFEIIPASDTAPGTGAVAGAGARGADDAPDSSAARYFVIRREWRQGDVVTVEFDMTPRWTFPDRRVDAIRGCVAVERGPLVYCFEQADQPDGVAVDDLALVPGGHPSSAEQGLTARAVTVPGIGRTVQLLAPGVHLPPVNGTVSRALPAPEDTSATPVTAVAIPYFHWDNRDGRAMRVWLPAR